MANPIGKDRLSQLFGYEQEVLLEALRRDMLSESLRAYIEPDSAIWHNHNARTIKNILHILTKE